MIPIPDAAKQAMLNGTGQFVTLLELLLRGQSPRRWTTSSRGISYQPVGDNAAVDWDKNTPLLAVQSVAGEPEPGMASIVLKDPLLARWRNIQAAGERGNAIRVIRVLFYGADLAWETDRYKGKTLRASSFRRPGDEGYAVQIECADALRYPNPSRVVYTDKGYQRGIDATDNSCDFAHQARELRWHATREAPSS